MNQPRIPADVEWELVVVNNNSTDRTDSVIASHERALPIRRLCEGTPGCAAPVITRSPRQRGEWILWTDDDVLVDPEWLAAYNEAARRWPDAGYFGGLIEPWFQMLAPLSWILENRKILEGVLAIRDFGREEHYLADDETPWSANMAVRTELFKNNPFDPSHGCHGRWWLSRG